MFEMCCGIPNAYSLDITMYKMQVPLVLIIEVEYFGYKILTGTYKGGDHGSTVVKVLCYKSEGRWFDSSWCQWNFSLT